MGANETTNTNLHMLKIVNHEELAGLSRASRYQSFSGRRHPCKQLTVTSMMQTRNKAMPSHHMSGRVRKGNREKTRKPTE
jgi:hypothetical protein